MIHAWVVIIYGKSKIYTLNAVVSVNFHFTQKNALDANVVHF